MLKFRKKRRLEFWIKIWWAILFLVFFLMIIIFHVYTRKVLAEQTTENVQKTLEIYVNGIDTTLENIESYLHLSFQNSEDIVTIESGLDKTSIFFAKQNISRTLNKICSWNSDFSELIYYYRDGDNYITISAGIINEVEKKQQLEKYLIEDLEQSKEKRSMISGGYSFSTVGQDVYLIRYYKVSNSYIGMAVSTGTIFGALKSLQSEKGVDIFLTDESGNILDATREIKGKLLPDNNGNFVALDGINYLQSEVLSAKGKFYIGTLTEQEMVYKKGDRINKIILSFFVMVNFVFFPTSIWILNRFVTRPVGQLVNNMQNLGEGNFDIQMTEDSKILEYYTLENTFNVMSREIKNLKIENYESRIQTQKAQLQYLQLQINPHFYLNALNIIYSLAEIQDYGKIQEMTMHLVNYSRYMFHDATALVTIEEELKHVADYIKIQEMRFLDTINFHEELEDAVRRVLIPPFVLQSFIENSIKYALKYKKNNSLTLIGITDKLDENYVLLKIRDNGEGYSSEVLTAINQNGTVNEDSERNIGIRNVKERLRLIYGNRANVKIYNDDGAVTEIRIPLISKD